jgi:hypothetical protein
MSNVTSFRLDNDNPREEKTGRVLKAWYEEGYNQRYILTDTLLIINEPHSEQADTNALKEVNEKVKKSPPIEDTI